jgi:ribonuclease HII
MRPAPAGGKFRCEATLERELRARGFHAVAGADEVGRGALFGAVFAGAVILSNDRPVRGLNDSKLLEPERREVLAERIRERAVAWAVAAVDAGTIDRIPSTDWRRTRAIRRRSTTARWNSMGPLPCTD